METTRSAPWTWETASGSAIVRSLIEVLARRGIVTVEEVMGVLSEPLSSDKITKGETPEPVPDLRQEVANLKVDLEVAKAQIWALGDFFCRLDEALCVVARDSEAVKAVRAEFTSGLRELYARKNDPEEQVQRQFRRDVFDGL